MLISKKARRFLLAALALLVSALMGGCGGPYGCNRTRSGCLTWGEEFVASCSNEEAGNGVCPTGGAGGTAGNGGTGGQGGVGGSTGGTSTSTETAGNGGEGGMGGQGGVGGSTGGTGGSGGCPDLTPQVLAGVLETPCQDLFLPSDCQSDVALSHEGMSESVLSQYPELLQGYTEPTVPSFADVTTDSAINQLVWLGLEAADLSGEFFPETPTTLCDAQALVDALKALSTQYWVLKSVNPATTLGSGLGAVTSATYHVYGTDPEHHLTGEVGVVNNLSGDFTSPEPTNALEAVVVRCEDPVANGSFAGSPAALSGGQASFSLDCWKANGAPLPVQIQMDPAPNGAGAQARLGIDPALVILRGWPNEQGGPMPTLVNIN